MSEIFIEYLSEKDIPVCNKLNLSLNFSMCKYTFLTENVNNATKKENILKLLEHFKNAFVTRLELAREDRIAFQVQPLNHSGTQTIKA